MESKEHIRKTKTGLKWSFMNQFGTQLINLVVGILLARLIHPSEFGLLAMITLFVNFATIFIDFGFSSVLIQKTNVSKEDINTVFVCNYCIGITLYLIFFFSAPIISAFYDEPRLIILTRIVAISFLITPLNAGRSALISREMNFKLGTKISIVSLIISSTIAIVCALNGLGVWSIVMQSLTNSLVSALYFRLLSGHRPSFSFSRDSFRSMSKMSTSLAADSIVNYWSRNGDNLMVGKMLGSSSLGIYNKAYSLMLLPLTNITRVIIRVMLPSFSRIKDDKLEIKRIYLKTIELIACLSFPMMFGLAAIPDLFIYTLFGANWAEMIPLIQLFAFVGAVQSILALNGTIYVSQGKANLAFRVSLIFNILFLISVFTGISIGGLLGAGIAYSAISIISSYPILYLATRLIYVKFKDIVNRLGKIFLASCVMFILVWLFNYYKPLAMLPIVYQFMITMLLGAFIYICLIFLLRIRIYFELKQKVQKRLKKN